ncbi:MAG: L,D-transpeptidase family protein [Verrucomicrobiales bacterium]|nr:L,D-transpeptidase family protein [Verrucomicrobiales bacterium]
MSFTRLLLLTFTAALFIGTPATHAQDGNLFAALFGAKQAKTSSSSSSRYSGKRVEIDLTKQQLKAYQGNRVVLRTRISSGKTGNTPTGNFKAGPYKSATHFSSLYHNAPMPWSVQITGNIFIHGFSVVPNYPASKGCVRVPIDGRNPAKRLFNWIDIGTPVRVFY